MTKSFEMMADLPGELGVMMAASFQNAVLPAMNERPDRQQRPERGDAGQASESSFDLLLRAKQGDAEAVDRLWARYLPRLRRWAHGRLPATARGPLDTEDLAQDVLARAIQRIGTFEPRHEGGFQAYLREMLKNRVLDEGRRLARRPAQAPLTDEHVAANPSPLEVAIGQEALERYEAALERLRPQDRELLVARIEMNFSAAEIAAAFGKPTPAAAQMAVSRALVRLAEEMAHG